MAANFTQIFEFHAVITFLTKFKNMKYKNQLTLKKLINIL